jgi:WD40 repeat protein
MSNKE